MSTNYSHMKNYKIEQQININYVLYYFMGSSKFSIEFFLKKAIPVNFISNSEF